MRLQSKELLCCLLLSAPSGREQKSRNSLPSGFGDRMNGRASGQVPLDLAIFSDTWRGGCVKAARDGGGPERCAARHSRHPSIPRKPALWAAAGLAGGRWPVASTGSTTTAAGTSTGSATAHFDGLNYRWGNGGVMVKD